MTELQFLVDLLLNHKLNTSTKAHIAARMKEVEEHMRAQPQSQRPVQAGRPNPTAQAPSMAALMEKHATGEAPVPIPTIMESMPAPIPPSALATNRIIGGEKITGNGTRGPRKF